MSLAQRIGFRVPKAPFPQPKTAPSAQRIGSKVLKAPFPQPKTLPLVQRSAFRVPQVASSACRAAFGHALHFGTHPNANPGTHRNAGPRVLPTKPQLDESAEELPHFGTHPNANPGTHRNTGGPDVSKSRRPVGRARSLCQPTCRFPHNVFRSACPKRRFALAYAAYDTTFAKLSVLSGVSRLDMPLSTQHSAFCVSQAAFRLRTCRF